MSPKPSGPRCEGSSNFDPEAYFKSWPSSPGTQNDDLETLIKQTFGLSASDSYVYHAVASVTLGEVQRAIGHGGQLGLHAWYLDEQGKQVLLRLPQRTCEAQADSRRSSRSHHRHNPK